MCSGHKPTENGMASLKKPAEIRKLTLVYLPFKSL